MEEGEIILWEQALECESRSMMAITIQLAKKSIVIHLGYVIVPPFLDTSFVLQQNKQSTVVSVESSLCYELLWRKFCL